MSFQNLTPGAGQATRPTLTNPSPNLENLGTSPDSPLPKSYANIDGVTYRAIGSDYSLGSATEEASLSLILKANEADIAANPEDPFVALRASTIVPINVSVLREDGSYIRAYDVRVKGRVMQTGNTAVVVFTGSYGSIRN